MKYLLLILSIGVFIGCNDGEGRHNPNYIAADKHDSTPKKEQFHIKVRPYGSGCGFWEIVFTKDSFNTEEQILHACDISDMTGEVDVSLIPELPNNEKEAVAFAKRFKSYQDCREYNRVESRQYDSLLAYRQRVPPHKKGIWATQEECEPGKEILVH